MVRPINIDPNSDTVINMNGGAQSSTSVVQTPTEISLDMILDGGLNEINRADVEKQVDDTFNEIKWSSIVSSEQRDDLISNAKGLLATAFASIKGQNESGVSSLT